VTGAFVDGVWSEHHDGALDVGDRSPLVDLAGAHPQHVAGAKGIVGEVDGVHGCAALDVEQQVEVETLCGEELVRPAAVTDALQRVHLDVADTGRRRLEAYAPNSRLSGFYHQPASRDRENRFRGS